MNGWDVDEADLVPLAEMAPRPPKSSAAGSRPTTPPWGKEPPSPPLAQKPAPASEVELEPIDISDLPVPVSRGARPASPVAHGRSAPGSASISADEVVDLPGLPEAETLPDLPGLLAPKPVFARSSIPAPRLAGEHAPRGPGPTGWAVPPAELPDLPAPKSFADLPAPKPSIDLPAPKRPSGGLAPCQSSIPFSPSSSPSPRAGAGRSAVELEPDLLDLPVPLPEGGAAMAYQSSSPRGAAVEVDGSIDIDGWAPAGSDDRMESAVLVTSQGLGGEDTAAIVDLPVAATEEDEPALDLSFAANGRPPRQPLLPAPLDPETITFTDVPDDTPGAMRLDLTDLPIGKEPASAPPEHAAAADRPEGLPAGCAPAVPLATGAAPRSNVAASIARGSSARKSARSQQAGAFARLRQRPRLLFGAGAAALIAIAGMCVGLLTDLGFFGAGWITGRTADVRRARAQVDSARGLLLADTYSDYGQAAAQLEQAATTSPSDPLPRVLLAQTMGALAYRFGPDPARRARAEELLSSVSHADPDLGAEIELAKGLIALAGRQTPAALSALRSLAPARPADAWFSVANGWAELAANKAEAAKAAFTRAREAHSGAPAALFGLARATLALGDAAGCRQLLGQALAGSPRHAGALLLRAKLDLEVGQAAAAQTDLHKVVSLGAQAAPAERAAALVSLGQAAHREGQNDEARTRFEGALRLHGRCAEARLGLAQLLYDSGRHTDALAQLKQAETLDPGHREVALLQARIVLASGRPAEARDVLQRIQGGAPPTADILHLQGVVDVELEQLEAAEKHFSAALEKDPSFFPSYLELGRLRLKLGKPAEALELLDKAAARMPGSAKVANAQGEVYLAMSKLAEARVKFEESIRLDPGHNAAIFNLASTLRGQGDLAAARARYEELFARDKEHPRLAERLGELCLQMKETALAARFYETALAAESVSRELRLAAARAFIAAGENDKAAEQAGLLLREDSSLAAARALRAEALLGQGRLGDALIEVQQAIGREPAASFSALLGRIYEAIGKPGEAIDAYADALKLDAKIEGVRTRRAILLVKSGAVKDGLTELKALVAARPDSGELHLFMGEALANLGEEQQALRAYRAAVARDATLGLAHYRIGVLEAERRQPGAMTHLQLAVRHAGSSDTWRADAWLQLGSEAARREQRRVAIEALREYLKLAPAGAALRSEARRRLKELGADPAAASSSGAGAGARGRGGPTPTPGAGAGAGAGAPAGAAAAAGALDGDGAGARAR